MAHGPIPDRQKTSLYHCEKCGNVVRFKAGRTALGHIHYDVDGSYLGKDAEGRYIEFPDDGREGIPDLTREGVWRA
jgi:hypothetical protein